MADLAVRYPEYEPDARFKCSQSCGTFGRRDCYTFRGRLVCPRCRYVGTLAFVPALQSETSL